MPDNEVTLEEVRSRVSPEVWARRVAAAKGEAERLETVLALIRAGSDRNAALRKAYGSRPLSTAKDRLARYEQGGMEALISRRVPSPSTVVTPEVMQMVRGMLAVDPELRSPALCAALAKAGHHVGESTLREHLRGEGLSHPVGPPSRSRARQVTALPLAGAELWKAADLELGAVAHLTGAMGRHLDGLPPPSGEVLDDRANRDEEGRFLSEYNQPKARTEPELGGKFDTVERRRGEKDLQQMRAANSSFDARYRKDLALTLMPVTVDAPRWTVLRHWQGDYLGPLVGYPYRPATLDKHARELKLSGAAVPARDAVTSFWLSRPDQAVDEQTGAVVVYCDVATKPIWTHHFTQCAKVSKTGRVMPATSTLYLHTGAGTPLLYRAFSGQVSVPQQTPALLRDYEQVAGRGTVRRVVVLDRESHAVWLFKELAAHDWTYIVPLRKSVVGPNARFEDLGEWEPYGENGDAVRSGLLWLNDSRKGEPSLKSRVVGRRRHRTGKVAWFATNAAVEEFGSSDVMRLYFDRWPLQELVFRDGNGRVGLDVHHGYGKKKITDVAVVDRSERLEGRMRALEQQGADAQRSRASLVQQIEERRAAVGKVEGRVAAGAATLDVLMASRKADTEAFRSEYGVVRALESWLPSARRELEQLEEAESVATKRAAEAEATLERLAAEHERLERRRRIFTVDTELDQIMTAYKLTFMNVAMYLMRHVLGVNMELDTLIRGILTLPGERVRTPTTETVRIYRQKRDASAMDAVERACAYFNAKRLRRDERVLCFELVEALAAP